VSATAIVDALPIWAVFALGVTILLAVFEVGYRVGEWWQRRTPDEHEGPTSMLVGSVLALLAFLLAVTMGMASDRFDARRGLVLDEANEIGTAYLRAGYLPAPYGEESRALLRAYVPLRINTADTAILDANFARSEVVQGQLWAMAEELAVAHPDWDMIGLYVESLNDVIDVHEARVAAIEYARVPETIVIALLLLSCLSLGMVGYSAGLTRHRSVLSATVLAIVLSGVLTLVIDLDRPRDGFLQVSQQPLLDLERELGSAVP
jgi:protein-S-isoprenylcysteine O-methyltransferase Ste14